MWLGGLPPLGCVAAPKSRHLLKIFGSAPHSNGGKPPRHNELLGSCRLIDLIRIFLRHLPL